MNITLDRIRAKPLTSLGVLVLLIAAPSVSRATTAYSNFGAGFAYNTTQGLVVGNDLAGDNLAEADTFTPSSTLDFSTIEIALSCLATGDCPNSFTVDLTTDNSGVPNTSGGGVLASFTVTGSTLPIFGVSTHLTLTYAGSPLALNSGTAYWIAVLPDAGGVDQIVWNWNTTGDISSQAVASNGGGPSDAWLAPSGQTPGAYEVDGNPPGGVPEPGTFGMLLGGGLLLGLLRKIQG